MKHINFSNTRVFYAVIIFLVLFDRILKLTLKNTYQNKQAFFGFIQSPNKLIATVFPLAIMAILVFIFFKIKNDWQRIGIFAIILGGFSNFVDKIRVGAVIDYFAIPNFSRFNIADLIIYGGVIILVIKSIKSKVESR